MDPFSISGKAGLSRSLEGPGSSGGRSKLLTGGGEKNLGRQGGGSYESFSGSAVLGASWSQRRGHGGDGAKLRELG